MRCFKLMSHLAIIVPRVKPYKGDDDMFMIQKGDMHILDIVYQRRSCHVRQDRVGGSPMAGGLFPFRKRSLPYERVVAISQNGRCHLKI